MKKPVVITLAFVFSVSVLLSGASGYSDCAAMCAREMAKAQQHASMGSAELAAPNCCSGAMNNTCEMARTIEVKIPECSMASHQTVAPDPISIKYISGGTGLDNFRAAQSDWRFFAGAINSKLPIYLKTLTILC